MERANPKNHPAQADNRSEADEGCLLPPLTLVTSPSVAASQLQIPESARREFQKACAAIRKKKTTDAEKHLQRALTDSPRYAVAWVLMGQIRYMQQRTDEARRDCLQGSVADTGYVPAYLCLSDIAAHQRAWGEVLRFSTRAVELDPSSNAVAYEYQAAALLNLRDLSAAEKSAMRAVAMDLNHHEPRAHFVLAQVYEAKADTASEAAELREYLKYAKDSGDITFAKQALSTLEDRSGKAKAADPPLLLSATETQQAPTPRWAPEDIDEWMPPVLNAAACPLPKILEEAQNRTEDLIDNLQRFSANERIELTETDTRGRRRFSSASEVNYVAQIIRTASAYPRVEEYRSRAEDRRSSILDSGIATFALIFHPSHIGNFQFRCEGLTDVQGSSAWQLRFEEGNDPDKSFTAITVGRSVYLPKLKGRAWISAANSEILRIETDLVSPIAQIDLQLEHMVIEYAPVEFASRQVRLWLPKSTDIYLAFQGHHYERTHTFSQFQLFSVDSSETVRNKLANNALPGRTIQ